ncbi:hypothetical protein NQ318_016846 [Aromia moschata]|uniref:Mos1 transposase HTH domain-containing protein n=1 Tax=Aromia moschata TaxID=1265417 RepID=A0AAV8YVE3_9CUCU|nr:hypothetical protein NQ318_016846 [Aromia moschata]
MSEKEVPSSVAQRIIIKFLSREGIKPAEILRRLTAQFGDETLSRPRVFAWHKEFGQGREKVENEAHNRRPRTSITEDNIRAIRQLVEGDRRLTVAEISSVVGKSYGSAQAIITDQLGFRKVCASFVAQKQRDMEKAVDDH